MHDILNNVSDVGNKTDLNVETTVSPRNHTQDFHKLLLQGHRSRRSPGQADSRNENSDLRSSAFISATESGDYTYWLSQEDIANIARFRYGWYGDDGNVIFEVVGSKEQLRQQLQKYKGKLVKHKRQSLALIINLGGSHWVTLLVTHYNRPFLASYYIDSLGDGVPSWVHQVVREEILNISDLHTRQQEDEFNCGIFALENARMMSEDIQSDNDEQLFQVENYRPSRKKLQGIREDFMMVLRYYLGYGQSREGSSESIIDRCKKAIEYTEIEGMKEVENIDKERILDGLQRLLSIPMPSDGANLLSKLRLYHNSGIDEFSDEEREALRGLFDDIDLYKKISTRDRMMSGLGDDNSRKLYEDLLKIIGNNQDSNEINQDIEKFLDNNEVDITSRDSKKEISFLGQAIIEGRADYAISLINYCLYREIDISAAAGDENWTPLHFASAGGQSSITRSFFIEILNPIERYIIWRTYFRCKGYFSKAY